MTERLLQFIWQFQYFNKASLCTTTGEQLTIINPGKYNTQQGPDFFDGKVIIDKTTWAGNIEVHVKSSDWTLHKHSSDANYANVILHVVWEHNADIQYTDGSVLPVLEMQPLVAKILLERYALLMSVNSFVPCETLLPVMDDLKWVAWKQRLAIERLHRKSETVLQLLQETNNNWEEVFWWLLARNFGIKTNADIFEAIAKSIPVNVLAKHKNQIHQLEGLLLGQAGLLNQDFEEGYPNILKKEYLFYQKKYQLVQTGKKPYFLRMRPANFPTIRLAQLAMLVHNSSHLFSKIKEANTIESIKVMLNVTANDYWHYHYRFDEAAEFHPKQLGTQMVENIIINTIIPILFAYGNIYKDVDIKDRALHYLESLAPENNSITKKWKSCGVSNKNALESQALIELKNNYCDKSNCLQCSIGNMVLKMS
jgi:hypothetical protein